MIKPVTLWTSLFILFALLMAMAFTPTAASSQAAAQVEAQAQPNSADSAINADMNAAAAKLSPWVLEKTRAGQQAEFLVLLDEQADLSGAAQLPTREEKIRYVRQRLIDVATRTQAPLLAVLKQQRVPHRAFFIANAVWVKGNREVALRLARQPEVARVDGNPGILSIPEPELRPGGKPVERPAAIQGPRAGLSVLWNISQTHAPQVWAMGFTGQGIVIGGQDTGYAWDHPAIKSQYRGWNGSTADHNGNWHDSIHTAGSSCGVDSPIPCDDGYHGTHTMGTLVGDDGAGNQIGMAPGAQWMGCRNMNEGVGTPATYLECFEFFLAPYPIGGTPAQGDPALAPDVTNNSWGCPPSEGCTSASLLLAVQAQRAAGIMTVASAGNAGPSCGTVQDPIAIYDEVYSIGAIDSASNIAGFSSRGPVSIDGSNRPKPDLVAPGVGIVSSYSQGGFTTLQGTSMAGPHVAGAVALLWSARPLLKNQVAFTEALLNRTARPITVTNTCSSDGWPNNVFGYGELDIEAAVNAVPSNTVVITGVVSDLTTLQPISGALVSAAYVSPSLQFAARADADGQYTITVIPGTYTMTATAGGYAVSAAAVVAATIAQEQNFELSDAGPSPTITPTSTPTPTPTFASTLTATSTYTFTITSTSTKTSTPTSTIPALSTLQPRVYVPVLIQ